MALHITPEISEKISTLCLNIKPIVEAGIPLEINSLCDSWGGGSEINSFDMIFLTTLVSDSYRITADVAPYLEFILEKVYNDMINVKLTLNQQ
jgi:hypothetical protein